MANCAYSELDMRVMVQWMCPKCQKKGTVPYGIPVRCSCGNPPQTPVDRYCVNQSLDIVAVTSLKPEGPDRHQEMCIGSWERFGLDVLIVESVEKPTIASLVETARKKNGNILVINSDIELYGSNDCVSELMNTGMFGVGIRNNYVEMPEYNVAERYGLDAFFIPPDIQVPEDGFRIGIPLWDYWLPWHVTTVQKKPFHWLGHKTLFHKRHPLRWTESEWRASSDNFNAKYNPPPSWEGWRMEFDPVIVAGRLAWAALHFYSDSVIEWNPIEAKRWCRLVWIPMIPSYCSCSEHWNRITAILPPEFSSREGFRQWAIDAHNRVNAKLGKSLYVPSLKTLACAGKACGE